MRLRKRTPTRLGITVDNPKKKPPQQCDQCGAVEPSTHHPDCPVVTARLTRAGFRYVDGEWVDTLS